MTDSNPFALLRLCHLVSPALPVGAYAYSQGLEYAIHAGWIRDEVGVHEWISGISHHAVGTLDLPLLHRLYEAWRREDIASVTYWNAYLLASRETAELRAEERHLGRALARVLMTVDVEAARPWVDADSAFATLFALAATRWRIALEDTLQGYLWTWTENQVLAAIKLVPLGQSAGQRLLHRLIESMPGIAARAACIDDEEIGVAAVSQVLASTFHETQYSRLFRS